MILELFDYFRRRGLQKNDDQPVGANPMQKMKKEADRVNLLGSNEPNLGFSGDQKRFSNAEAKDITDRLKGMLNYTVVEREQESEYHPDGKYIVKEMSIPQEVIDFVREKLLILVNQLADGSSYGRSVYVTYELADILANGLWENKDHISAPRDIYYFNQVVAYLSYAVMFLEENSPPNDMGYMADTAVSLSRKDEIVRETLAQAYKLIAEKPDVLGPNTKEIYNKIVARLEPQRPTFMNRPVSYEKMVYFE